MRTYRTLSIVAGAFCLGLLGVAYFTWRQRDELRLQKEATLQRKAGLETEFRRAAQAAAARSAVRVETAPISPASESKAAPPTPRPILRTPSLVDIARDNPGLWNEFISAKKAELAQRYGPLFQSLGLGPEQREQIKVILAAKTARGADIAAAADAQFLKNDDPIVTALSKQSDEQMHSDLAALLGERGLAEFKEYQRTTQVRGFADGLAVQLAAIDPLNGQQADRLTRALASASARFRRGEYATSEDIDWSSAADQVRAILTPRQFAVWEQGNGQNVYGGSRQALELKRLYDQTLKASQPAGNGAAGEK